MNNLAERIDALLPQTQCTQCGFQGCRPYAEAIAAGEADINRCPPGGSTGIAKLAAMLGREVKPLNAECGVEGPRRLAVIDEAHCIGCTLCIQACPVDAIVGAAKLMHTVVAELCTGCDLCLPSCPVDCIAMVPAPRELAPWNDAKADDARARYETRSRRLQKQKIERAEQLASKAALHFPGDDAKRATIRAAIERARTRRAAVKNKNAGNEK
jgi:electron transport complex protein RnfB